MAAARFMGQGYIMDPSSSAKIDALNELKNLTGESCGFGSCRPETFILY